MQVHPRHWLFVGLTFAHRWNSCERSIRCITTVLKFINFANWKTVFYLFYVTEYWQALNLYTRQKTAVCRAAVRHWTTWRPAFLRRSHFKHLVVIGLIRDRRVTVVNGLWTAAELWFGVQQGWHLFWFKVPIPAPGPTQPPVNWILGALFHGCKAPMLWSWPLPFICWLGY